MKISQLIMRRAAMPLKQPFHTHLETVSVREAVIIEVRDDRGTAGWGEASAFSTPWYTEETVETEWHIIKELLFPILKGKTIHHPSGVNQLFQTIKGNRMAKAGVEAAVWDLYAKQMRQPLHKVLGGTKTVIEAGAVAAGKTTEEMLERFGLLAASGYKRIKVKVHPETDMELLAAIRKKFPDILLMADANSAYTLKEIKQLKKLDEFGLMMIEQPFESDDIWDHSKLQAVIKTPVCLDESICSLHDARCAVEMGACKVINVKFGRVGGLEEARRIHDFCLPRGIDIWAGGMIEFGISRAHNVALASLPGFTMPGDIVSTDHYWEQDIIEPGIFVEDGKIQLSNKPGIGYKVNQSRLEQITKAVYQL